MRGRLVKWLLRLLATLPLPIAHGLGSALGFLLALFPNSLRDVSKINLALCYPLLEDRDRADLLRRSLMETGKAMLEMGALWRWDSAQLMPMVRSVSGAEVVEAVRRQGRGVIFISPHLGAWELAGLYISAHYPMTTLYRPPRLAALENLSRTARARYGAKLVATDARGVRALFHALRHGEVVGILPDQNPDIGSGVFAPFFGIAAYTMVLIARLAQKTDAALIMAYAERLPRGAGYHLHFRQAPEAFSNADAEQAATLLNALIEGGVRAHPEQYQWSYKRFRIRPEGAAAPY